MFIIFITEIHLEIDILEEEMKLYHVLSSHQFYLFSAESNLCQTPLLINQYEVDALYYILVSYIHPNFNEFFSHLYLCKKIIFHKAKLIQFCKTIESNYIV